MAPENGSGDGAAPFHPSESFDGFDEGEIEEARNKIRGPELYRDSNDEVNSSEFEVGSDSDSDGVSDAGDDFLVDQPIERGRGPARRLGWGAARGRGTGPGRGQTATPPWSTTLIDPPDIHYRRAANVGVVDSDVCFLRCSSSAYSSRNISWETLLSRQTCMPSNAWRSHRDGEKLICHGPLSLCRNSEPW